MTGRAGPRKAARLTGAKRYFTGVPCLRGHVAERFVSTKACTRCAGESRSQWSKDNPAHTGLLAKQWRERNRERYLAQRKAGYRRNQAKYFAWVKARKLSQLLRTPRWADLKVIETFYSEARRLRELGTSVVVDHVIPLQGKTVSGLHVHTNLQILDARANREKSNLFQE